MKINYWNLKRTIKIIKRKEKEIKKEYKQWGCLTQFGGLLKHFGPSESKAFLTFHVYVWSG